MFVDPQLTRRPTYWCFRCSYRQQYYDLECCDIWTSWHPFWGWHIQTYDRVHRGISQQTTYCEICIENVPSKCVCGWRHMFRHPTEQMESHIWCFCYFNLYSGTFYAFISWVSNSIMLELNPVHVNDNKMTHETWTILASKSILLCSMLLESHINLFTNNWLMKWTQKPFFKLNYGAGLPDVKW